MQQNEELAGAVQFLLEAGSAIVLAALLVCIWVFMWVVTP